MNYHLLNYYHFNMRLDVDIINVRNSILFNHESFYRTPKYMQMYVFTYILMTFS